MEFCWLVRSVTYEVQFLGECLPVVTAESG